MSEEKKSKVQGNFKFEGNAAKIIREKQAERILADKPIGVERAIRELLCDCYNRKHNTKHEC